MRKAVREFPQDPVYVIVVQCALFTSRRKAMARLTKQVQCPGRTFFMHRLGLNRRLRQELRDHGQRLM